MTHAGLNEAGPEIRGEAADMRQQSHAADVEAVAGGAKIFPGEPARWTSDRNFTPHRRHGVFSGKDNSAGKAARAAKIFGAVRSRVHFQRLAPDSPARP